MRNRSLGWVFGAATVAAVLGSSSPAFAQEKGKVGLTIAFPSSVGVVFHVTDKIAIRPEFNFEQGSTEITSAVLGSSSDTTVIGTGVSALCYVHAWDDLHLYVTPRWDYSHASSSSAVTETTGTGWGLTGSIGAQYALGKRFAVFGEVGIGYSQSSTKGPVPIETEIKSHSVGLRSGVGVIVYFK
jgi:opacity protein-like surface antigen